MIDQKLKDFATPIQWKKYTLAMSVGFNEADRQLGITKGACSRATFAIKKKAALSGYSPDHDMTKSVPEGFTVKGVSTYYNQDGVQTAQWVKSAQDRDAQVAALVERIEAIADTVKPLKPVKPPKNSDADLLNIFPLGDPHVGMYAHAQEAGENFDCEIARQDLLNAMAYLVDAAPPAKECLILNVGDFFHADDPSNSTPQNNNKLDVDGRWHRVLEMGFLLLVDLIVLALKKHEIVRVRSTPGNHDPTSTIPLTLFIRAWFKDEQRVIVEDATKIHQYQAFGKCIFGFTHGDKIKKPAELGALMAVDCEEIWSKSKHRYWLHGHFHSRRLIEALGCLVEGFRNLAPNDAWAQGAGFRSGRDMNVITYHKDYGEISRSTCDITRLKNDR